MKRAIGLCAACLAVGFILVGCRGIVSILKPPDPTSNKIQANIVPAST